MDIVVKILLWIHLMALVGGGTAAVAMPVIGSRMAGATPEVRTTLFAISDRVVAAARASLLVLLITGPLMFWLKWNFSAPSMIWFGIKMVLIVVLLVGVIIGGINGKKAQNGDLGALKRAALGTRLTGLALIGVVLAAVFAFN